MKVHVAVAIAISASLVVGFGLGYFFFGIEEDKQGTYPLYLDGEIRFYENTSQTGVFAVGMVMKNRTSMVFLWNESSNMIMDVESACTINQSQSMISQYYAMILFSNATSGYTDNRIVPSLLTINSPGSCNFTYYDGYGPHWSYGDAVIYSSNQTIQWLGHVK